MCCKKNQTDKSTREYGRGWEFFFFLSEIAILIFYIVGATYGPNAYSNATNQTGFDADNSRATESMQLTYPIWMDINVMTFVGYGFLKAFLKTNNWTAIGFNFIIAAMACQFAIICNGFWNIVLVTNVWDKIPIDISSLI